MLSRIWLPTLVLGIFANCGWALGQGLPNCPKGQIPTGCDAPDPRCRPNFYSQPVKDSAKLCLDTLVSKQCASFYWENCCNIQCGTLTSNFESKQKCRQRCLDGLADIPLQTINTKGGVK